jgi:predicted kinase
VEAVILIGVQGAGKTAFYTSRLLHTHVRIGLDLLRSRERERILIGACFDAKQPFAIDNTNVLRSERAMYIHPARQAGFRIIGYFVRVELKAAIARNRARTGKQAVPLPGLLRTWKRLESPHIDEGFDELYIVTPDRENDFTIMPWEPELAIADSSRSTP